jgi:hypothetical protein
MQNPEFVFSVVVAGGGDAELSVSGASDASVVAAVAVVVGVSVADGGLEGIGNGMIAETSAANAAAALLCTTPAASELELGPAMKVVEVTVGRGGRVDPSGLTVTSCTLFTVLRGGALAVMSFVEVATPGTIVMLLELAVTAVAAEWSAPSKPEASAAACECASTADEVVLVPEFMDVEELCATEKLVTIVTVCITGACAGGMTKFGAMLIAGCSLPQLHAVGSTRREGRLL